MAIPTNGLDFYLPFDADMDEKIHSLTGTLSSSNAAKYFMLSSDTAGNFLQCINTQGGNSCYLKYPGSESLMQYGTGDFSVSFWLRSPNWSYFTNVVFEKKYDDNQDGFVVYADGSEPVLDMRIRNQADHFTETYCNSSVFLHWCFVRVGTVGYWYCNGVLDSTTEGETTGSVSSDEQFKIGYSAAWNWKQAVFDLKALRIYNRALSDSEITELSKEFRGTSSLDTVLLALDGARDALVTAINAKGGSLSDSATLYQCADAIGSLSGGGGEQQEPVLLSPTNVTEDTLASNTATNAYGTWSFSASNKASGYEPSALFMESYDNFTFGVESTHWLLVECTNTFAPESLYFYAGGSNVLGYTPKTLEIYGTSNGVEYLLGTATLVSTDQDANGLSNTVEATIGLDHGGRTYSSIKIIQTSNQTNTSVQAIWRKIEIRGYDTAVVTPCTAEYYKCASVDTGSKTWSGYKAVFDSGTGTWSFESNVTEGLEYKGLTPVVSKIYSADTTVQIAYLKLAGILNDETVKFLLYPKSSGTLEDISAGGNGVTVTNTGNVAVENNRIVFGDGKALTIPANTLPDDIFVAGKPFLIEFQGIIPTYTSVTCGAFARKDGSMYYDRLDMYLNTIQGDAKYGKMTIGYWTNNVTVPVGAFTVGAEHVVAFEYDGDNTSRVYLDGVLQYSFTGTSYLPFRTVDFLIGHDTDAIGGSNANPFQGNMSYFRIRNVAPYKGASYTPEWV